MKNVLEWLEAAADKNPEKIAYRYKEETLTFGQTLDLAKRIGSALLEKNLSDKPIAVLLDKHPSTIAAFLGVVYSGHAYAPLDVTMPEARLEKILENLQPSAIVTEEEFAKKFTGISRLDESIRAADAEADGTDGNPQKAEQKPQKSERTDEPKEGSAIGENLLDFRELASATIVEEQLQKVRRGMVMTDPLYIIYTSGSSGRPKGVMTSHQSLICYIRDYARVMGIRADDVLGNQSQLDYIAAIRDIYVPLLTGASTVLFGKELFMQPDVLFEEMDKYGVTAIGWSTSALTILTTLGAFQDQKLQSLNKVCFSGSVMPAKVLALWQKNLPGCRFVNQYGPTEATASCTYYVLDHMVEEGENIPIGQAYDDYRVFLLSDEDRATPDGELGQICVAGPILALAYYNDPERTKASFVQNPLNKSYQELIYKTGDIGRVREDGLLEFHGRRDRQIKHMGHRVELDEVECAAMEVGGVKECACLYQTEKEVLWLFYSGEISVRDLMKALRSDLPLYMVPRKIKNIEIPRLPNGKTDLQSLRAMMTK